MKQKPRSSFVKKSIMRESHFEVNPTVIQITIREMYKWKEARLKNIPTACPNQLYVGQNDKSKQNVPKFFITFKLSTISKLFNTVLNGFTNIDIWYCTCHMHSHLRALSRYFLQPVLFFFKPRSPQQHALPASSKMEAICLIDNQMMRCYFFEIIRDVTTKPKTLFMLNTTTISCCKKRTTA